MHPPSLVDIGINLAHDSYDADRDDVIRRAAAAGVRRLVVTGSSVASSRRALELARAHPGRLYATAGVHPHHAHELSTADLPALRTLLAEPEVVAAGECGLDYFRDYSPHDAQERAFRAQLELAIDARRPLFLHQRDAHADFVRILRSYGRDLPPAVAHCFTGTADEAAEYLDMGLHVGITGWICDERRGRHLDAVVRLVPADRLMLETDGPYLLPRDLEPKPKSRRNEPMYLPHVCAAVARARGEPPETLARATTATAVRFFGLAEVAEAVA
ncbi:MAG: TatD family hydrolase [Steroidobacteraceae bacterium]|jgi:TatD DNase family protein|nr:TatD family hydrolase [Steroidobacteraceae bacterium]